MEKHAYYVLLTFVLLGVIGIEFIRQEVVAQMEYDAILEERRAYESRQIVIPITVHLIEEPSGRFSTDRDTQNVVGLFTQTNELWQQANISFVVDKIVTDTVPPNFIPRVLNKQISLVEHLETYEDGQFNVIFTDNIRANGIAFLRSGFLMVADRTTVYDYRTTAHELGHLLGLHHVSDRSRLMFSGSNGMILTPEEIEIARNNALLLFS